MANRKKILFVVEVMDGGVFTYIVDLANGLANMTDENGSYIYDMYVAYRIRKQTPKDYKRYVDKKIHMIQAESFGRSINAGKNVKVFFEIKRIANKVEPDIIYLHSSKAGVLGRVAFNGYKVNGKPDPFFYTPHGYSFLMKNQSAAKRIVYKIIEGGCGKLNCITIPCSKGEHDETLRLNKKAVYVNNGINVKELKNKNIEITSLGDRKTALEKAMTTDVFILTSLCEGLPISLLEAMYMKKPCVVSDVIGNHKVINSGLNGFVSDGVNDFVKAVRAVFSTRCWQISYVAAEKAVA